MLHFLSVFFLLKISLLYRNLKHFCKVILVFMSILSNWGEVYLVYLQRAYSREHSASDFMSESSSGVFRTLVMLELWRPEWDTPTYWQVDEREVHMFGGWSFSHFLSTLHVCSLLQTHQCFFFLMFYSPMLFSNQYNMLPCSVLTFVSSPFLLGYRQYLLALMKPWILATWLWAQVTVSTFSHSFCHNYIEQQSSRVVISEDGFTVVKS